MPARNMKAKPTGMGHSPVPITSASRKRSRHLSGSSSAQVAHDSQSAVASRDVLVKLSVMPSSKEATSAAETEKPDTFESSHASFAGSSCCAAAIATADATSGTVMLANARTSATSS